jgi:hypothetical protein
MKKSILTIALGVFCIIGANAQTNKNENQLSEIYRPQIWKATDYINLIETIQFKPIKNAKNYSIRDIKAALLTFNSDDINQMNITGSYYCSVKHEEMYQLWNLYYPTINKSFWDTNCKGLIALMDFDGFIIK